MSFPSDFGVAMMNPSQFDLWSTGRFSSARYRGVVSAFSPVNMKDTFAVVPTKIKHTIFLYYCYKGHLLFSIYTLRIG